MENELSAIQREIVETPGNLIVKASAGTGKTHTLVSKIAYEKSNRLDHKVIAAITFTIKATNELRTRLAYQVTDDFIGTNNMFAIEEIIRPFLKDYMGMDWDINISTDYSLKFDTYVEGMKLLFEKKMIGSYNNSKMNFVFQLALNILSNSRACQLYLQSKYFKIYIDEYQDCDKDMHNFFMYICDELKIETFVVGDEKQSIYVWRGAYPKAFLSISNKDTFTTKTMRENFRSCKQIQNYSNLLCEDTRNLYSPVRDLSNIILIKCNEVEWVSKLIPLINKNQKFAILRHRKDSAKECADLLTQNNFETIYIPPTPIDDISTEASWLYRTIAEYFIIKDYSEYDFINIIPNMSDDKDLYNQMKMHLKKIAKFKNEIDKFSEAVVSLAKYLGYESKKEDIEKLYNTINDEVYFPAFFIDQLTRASMTIHSSKGLEFDQVVLFAEDYNMSEEEEIYKHYVASTRAKIKLIIIYLEDHYWKKNFDKIGNILKKSNLRFSDIGTIV